MAEPQIWQLDERDAEAAGAVLSRAFLEDDPLFRYAVPDREERAHLCPPLFATYVRYACHFGEAWGIGPERDRLAGVLYWVELPHEEVTPALVEQWGLNEAIAMWGAAHDRLEAAEGPAHAQIDAMMPEPRRYLGMLGVDHAWQGQGLGTALLEKLLTDARSAGVPVSTWTFTPRNVPLYQRVGFTLVAEGASLDGALPWWAFLTPDASPRSRPTRSSSTWLTAAERQAGPSADT
jgi:GNAT superfamily N-acetyltransferase